MQPATGNLHLRPRSPEDDLSIAALHARQEPDGAPLPEGRYQYQPSDTAEGREQWVAELGGRLAGYGGFSPAWWTGDPRIHAVELRVEAEYADRGIGSRLYAHLQERLAARGAARLLGWVRADDERARCFARHRGFKETGQAVQDYRLELSRIAAERDVESEVRLRRQGLRLATLAELFPDEAFLHALHRVASGYEPALPDAPLPGFASWRREVLEGPGLSPETHWVALDGTIPVALTLLKRLTETAAENDFTGVAPSYRGRGIALALKRRAIEWGQRHGVSEFFTSSELGNAAMIGINRRLGYRPGPIRVEVARALP